MNRKNLNRYDFQKLALLRLKEAEVLFNNRCYGGTYYIFGYSVECALKACIAKNTKRFDFPEKERVNKSYTHDLTSLISIAGLKEELEKEMKIDTNFAANWNKVKDWSEISRYNKDINKIDAKDLLSAITENNNGILKWLKKYW